MRVPVLCIVVRVLVSLLCAAPAGAQTQPASEEQAPAVDAGSAPEAAAPPARRRLSDAGELQRIVSLYDGGKYEECAREVSQLLDTNSSERLVNREVVEQARLYHATCLVMMGRENEAIAPLRAAFQENATLGTPDSLTFPPPLIALFLQVRTEFREAIRVEEERRLRELQRAADEAKAEELAEQRRVAALEKMARTESVVRLNSRMVASIPFGVGQFQNDDDVLGGVFLTSEILLLGTSIVAVGVALDQYAHYGSNVFGSDIEANVTTARKVAIGTFYGFVGVAAIGIAEANINFVPRFRYQRQRELPEALKKSRQNSGTSPQQSSWLPWVEPTSGGMHAGVVGTF